MDTSDIDQLIATGLAGISEQRKETEKMFAKLSPEQLAANPALADKKRALDSQTGELLSILQLWQAARLPVEPDGEWKGEGWIKGARCWIAMISAARAAKQIPEFIGAAEQGARDGFQILKNERDRMSHEAPLEYGRFIAEADALADEAREMFG